MRLGLLYLPMTLDPHISISCIEFEEMHHDQELCLCVPNYRGNKRKPTNRLVGSEVRSPNANEDP